MNVMDSATILSPQLQQRAITLPQAFQSLEALQYPMLELIAHVQQELKDIICKYGHIKLC